MKLTRLDVADVSALAALHALAFEASWSETAFRELLEGPGVFALAADEGAGLVGVILLRAVADEAEVLTLAVAPARRRQGVAAGLLEAGLALATAVGAATAFLEVAEDNQAAIGLYRGVGFEPIGRRGAYYPRPAGPAVAALILRKELVEANP